MKPTSESTIVGLPREPKTHGDDCYLIEMNERLRRLRSLLGEQERMNGSKSRWKSQRHFSGFM